MQGEEEREEWQRSLHEELEDLGVAPNRYVTTTKQWDLQPNATTQQEEDWVDRPSEGRLCSPQVTAASSAASSTSAAPIPPPPATKRFAKFAMPTKKF